MKKLDLKFGIIAGIVLLVGISRMVPHMPNYSPMAAIALFGAAHLGKVWKSLFLTFTSLFISDILLNNTVYASMNNGFTVFYDGFIWQYLAYGMITLLSLNWFHKISTMRVIGGSVIATILFFIISNFGAWISLPFYSKDVNGLTMAYLAGLPFLKGTFLSDLVYSIILFGGYYLLQQRYTAFRLSHLSYSK